MSYVKEKVVWFFTDAPRSVYYTGCILMGVAAYGLSEVLT